MSNPAAVLRARLEARFDEIARTRMQGVPILNAAIKVAALGFEAREGAPLGILVTPWFMNLVILPDKDEGWATGDKCRLTLPAGAFEFIVTRDEELGPLLMCSLFSPMFEFADQQAALETARAALAEILNPESRPEGNADLEALEGVRPEPFLPGREPAADEAPAAPETGLQEAGRQGGAAAPEEAAPSEEAAPAGRKHAPSRRDLLAGRPAGRAP